MLLRSTFLVIFCNLKSFFYYVMFKQEIFKTFFKCFIFLYIRHGRKPTFVIGCCAYIIISVATSFLPNISSLLAARAIQGFFHASVVQCGFTLGKY